MKRSTLRLLESAPTRWQRVKNVARRHKGKIALASVLAAGAGMKYHRERDLKHFPQDSSMSQASDNVGKDLTVGAAGAKIFDAASQMRKKYSQPGIKMARKGTSAVFQLDSNSKDAAGRTRPLVYSGSLTDPKLVDKIQTHAKTHKLDLSSDVLQRAGQMASQVHPKWYMRWGKRG